MRTTNREMKWDGKSSWETGMEDNFMSKSICQSQLGKFDFRYSWYLSYARSAKLNQECRIPDFSSPLIFSILFAWLPRMSLARQWLYKVYNILSSVIYFCLGVMILNWYHVLYTTSTASMEDCLPSVHFHDNELTPEHSFSFCYAYLHDR